MKKAILFGFFILLAVAAFPQSVMTFCPGPGLNDGTDEGGVNSGKDTFVYDELYTTNYGSSVYISTNPISTCNLTNLQAYLKFDVSGLPEDVDSVFLWVNNFPYNINCYSNCDNTFDFRFVTDPWNEMTMTWENKPASGEPFSDIIRITFPYNGGPMRIDFTHAYNAWRSGEIPNHGFTIFPLDGFCNNACVSFSPASSDHEDMEMRPYLEIYYSNLAIHENPDSFFDVRAFPNPATDELRLEFNIATQEAGRLVIHDHLGRTVQEMDITVPAIAGQGVRVNVSTLSPGFYCYRLMAPSGSTSGKFIVRRN
jgi:hypothetical protein